MTIFTLEKNDVLTVPAKALRFTINEALLQEGQKIEDCPGNHKLWTLDGNTFKAHAVEIGTSNGVSTEIISGIAADTDVLTDFTISGGEEESGAAEQASNPFMPKPRGNNKQQQKR